MRLIAVIMNEHTYCISRGPLILKMLFALFLSVFCHPFMLSYCPVQAGSGNAQTVSSYSCWCYWPWWAWLLLAIGIALVLGSACTCCILCTLCLVRKLTKKDADHRQGGHGPFGENTGKAHEVPMTYPPSTTGTPSAAGDNAAAV